ncbi:MAG: hypothetical protein AAGJ87_15015, partial [Pseudomonadota bacterium]
KTLRSNVEWYYRHNTDKAISALVNDSFFSREVSAYMYNARQLSLMTGTRLHGNIMGLAQGVPTFYAYHDLRVKEMAELFDVPRCDIREAPETLNLDDYDWTGFNKVYKDIYDGFKAFFAENNLSTVLE